MNKNELFIICCDLNNDVNSDLEMIKCLGIYTELENAKYDLKNIFKMTPDYKYYGYKIQVYKLIENKYKLTNKKYKYIFDKFIEYN